MVEKYKFMETTIANEKYLYYHPERPSIPAHRDIILKNSDKLRIVSYTHQFPDGAESICYGVQEYIPLERIFRNRKINFEELVLLLYGVVHTITNAKKCELIGDSFILDPVYVYLKHDSIQPYLMYLPTNTDLTLRDEFLTLLNFLDGAADPEMPDTKKLVAVIKDIILDDFDMHSIINVIVQAANNKEVVAPKKSNKLQSVKNEKNEKIKALSQPAAPSASAAVKPETNSASTAPPKSQPAPRSAPTLRKAVPETKQAEQKQGFFARFFGFGVKQKEPDDFLPTEDFKTMLNFTAYGDENRPVLYVMEGGSRTEQIPVTNDAFVLGSEPSKVDFCFEGGRKIGISGDHMSIIFDGSNYFAADRNSSGGTFVNDVRIAPGGSSPLKNGDIIGLYNKKKLLFELLEE